MARMCDRFLAESQQAMEILTTAEGTLTAPAAAALELRLNGALKWGARRRNSVKVNLMRQAELAAEMLDLDPTCIYTAEQFNAERSPLLGGGRSAARRDGTGPAPCA